MPFVCGESSQAPKQTKKAIRFGQGSVQTTRQPILDGRLRVVVLKVRVYDYDFITHAHDVTLFPAITCLPDSQYGVTVSKDPGVLPRASWFLGTLLPGHPSEPLFGEMEAPK